MVTDLQHCLILSTSDWHIFISEKLMSSFKMNKIVLLQKSSSKFTDSEIFFKNPQTDWLLWLTHFHFISSHLIKKLKKHHLYLVSSLFPQFPTFTYCCSIYKNNIPSLNWKNINKINPQPRWVEHPKWEKFCPPKFWILNQTIWNGSKLREFF